MVTRSWVWNFWWHGNGRRHPGHGSSIIQETYTNDLSITLRPPQIRPLSRHNLRSYIVTCSVCHRQEYLVCEISLYVLEFSPILTTFSLRTLWHHRVSLVTRVPKDRKTFREKIYRKTVPDSSDPVDLLSLSYEWTFLTTQHTPVLLSLSLSLSCTWRTIYFSSHFSLGVVLSLNPRMKQE